MRNILAILTILLLSAAPVDAGICVDTSNELNRICDCVLDVSFGAFDTTPTEQVRSDSNSIPTQLVVLNEAGSSYDALNANEGVNAFHPVQFRVSVRSERVEGISLHGILRPV